MTAKIRTNVYLDSDMKSQAKEIFKMYGVSLSDAINMFLAQSVMERGLPFEMKIPNNDTIKAIEEARADTNSDTISFTQLEEESAQCLQ
ncbi:MAG: type II toxin-antitoxin system RelB/DinJ family antitoxin [Sulfurimonas sp.]|nr:type II toxin-antitoxin system RelB/DinJ family antitoxin [Sulfurimonas sp.]